jgi:ABC-type branched-subunit amino acid transport system ATPase component
VRLGGASIRGKRACDLAAEGLSRTFQTARVFSTLTALQNLFIPLLHRGELERAAAARRAVELLAFVGLERHAEHTASELSGGQQRLLEFARALVTHPRLILMDEPFAGVHPTIKDTIMETILRMNREEHVTFLIVSHEMATLRRLCRRVTVMHEGRLIAEGTLDEVANHALVLEAYLGR